MNLIFIAWQRSKVAEIIHQSFYQKFLFLKGILITATGDNLAPLIEKWELAPSWKCRLPEDDSLAVLPDCCVYACEFKALHIYTD